MKPEDVQKLIEEKCDCICHVKKLNPWIKACPRCGCRNPEFDAEAVPPSYLLPYGERL